MLLLGVSPVETGGVGSDIGITSFGIVSIALVRDILSFILVQGITIIGSPLSVK